MGAQSREMSKKTCKKERSGSGERRWREEPPEGAQNPLTGPGQRWGGWTGPPPPPAAGSFLPSHTSLRPEPSSLTSRTPILAVGLEYGVFRLIRSAKTREATARKTRSERDNALGIVHRTDRGLPFVMPTA